MCINLATLISQFISSANSFDVRPIFRLNLLVREMEQVTVGNMNCEFPNMIKNNFTAPSYEELLRFYFKWSPHLTTCSCALGAGGRSLRRKD